MSRKNQLEPLEEGWVAFHTEDGERWRHKDLTEGRVGEGYRVFISDAGEERRYRFSATEPHDATTADLREQLTRADRVDAPGGTVSEGGDEGLR